MHVCLIGMTLELLLMLLFTIISLISFKKIICQYLLLICSNLGIVSFCVLKSWIMFALALTVQTS